MNKEQFEQLSDEAKVTLFDEFELEEGKPVHKEAKSLKEQLAESITKNSEKDAEIERLKAGHIKVLKEGQPMPVGDEEDPFVALFKNKF